MRPGPAIRPPAERFWAMVDKSDSCWLWRGAVNDAGYGRFMWTMGKVLQAHVAALLLVGVKVLAGQIVCHTCDNPPCVNPAHLFVGTQRDNLLDMTSKGRRRHAIGENASSAKLTAVDVVEIRHMYAAGIGYQRIGATFGIHQSTVSAIVSCRTWRHVG